MLRVGCCCTKLSNAAKGVWNLRKVDSQRLIQASLSASYNTAMSKPKVYVTRADIPEIGLQLLRERYDVTVWKETSAVPREELLKQVQGVDALFCLLTDKIDEHILEAAGPSLRAIATMSVGYDHIDLAAVAKRHIKLGFTPDVLTDAAAELTVALLLATSRRLFEAHDQIVKGKWGAWSPRWMCGPGLAGSTVGVVGFGRIGQEVAARLAAFKPAAILYTSRVAKETRCVHVSLDELLERSDFVVATCALTAETNKLFGVAEFRRMKHGAVFVNTSRGGVVDQDALLAALQSGEIAAAGLDVMVPEPLPPGHALLSLPNCVVLPHIGSATTQARDDMAALTARNIIAALEGQPLPAQVPA